MPSSAPLLRRLLPLLPVLIVAMAHAAPLTRIDLNTGWEFRQNSPEPAATTAAGWHPATVPGDVHLDLLANKLIPEPFARDNESKLQWISDASWQYRTIIHADAALLRRDHVDLVFEGLDSEAEVSVNGQHLLTAANMFRAFRVDAKAALHSGSNELLITFASPLKTGARVALLDRYHGKTPAPDKSYLRKAAYEYGWDWGPTFVTSGIWKPARIEAWDDARLDDLYLHQREITPALARVEAELTATAGAAAHATVTLEWSLNGQHHEITQTVDLVSGENHLTLPVEIPTPALWYPNGYGAQPLYAWKATLIVAGKEQDTRTAETGLRSVVLRREYDKFGRSFEFVVNGIPVYAKGADVIPFDSFNSRVTEPQYRHILQSAKDANMNIVRHWGGGLYESDTFYRVADELGIMVWQDFMFGNDWQPGTTSFREEVTREAEYQVTRLRNHPSIILWCGNNETEESLGWAKNAVAKTLDTAGQVRIWQDYLLLFSSILPRVVERLDSATPYWPSSPSANYEDDLAAGQHTGDSHNWDVWHGRVPFSTYETHHERFVSEYGFQSFPELRTVEAFTDPADRTSIFTPVMLAHQKNDEGNDIIHNYMLKDYVEPKDFPSLLYASQVLQAEGIKIGAEHLRRIKPENMGGIFWQLNDCWPVASWSSIDYFGRWKALQFYARRFYAPILVSPHVEDGALAVYVVSDQTTPTAAELRLRLMDFSGKVLREEKHQLTIAPLSSTVAQHLAITGMVPDGTDLSQIIAVAELTSAGKPLSSNAIYLVPTKNVHLPTTTVASEITPTEGGLRIRLTSTVLARAVHLELNLPTTSRPNLGDPDTLSDDFFTLLPNEPVDVIVKTTASADTVRSSLKVLSLVDAFPQAGAAQH